MSLQFAVFGTPISHSLSPQIHSAFGRQAGIDLRYVAIEAGAEDFAEKLQAFADAGGVGANVTMPLKILAAELAASLGERAKGMALARKVIKKTLGRMPHPRGPVSLRHERSVALGRPPGYQETVAVSVRNS